MQVMKLAQKLLNETNDNYQAFVYCCMNATKSEVIPFYDVYSAPFFTFSDGSIIEFVLEYDKEILSSEWFADIQDMIDFGNRWAA
jgi:hypothetical protein